MGFDWKLNFFLEARLVLLLVVNWLLMSTLEISVVMHNALYGGVNQLFFHSIALKDKATFESWGFALMRWILRIEFWTQLSL
jgi:hypothetical protein